MGALLNQNKDITVTALSPVVDILYQIERIKTQDLKCKNFPDFSSIDRVSKNIFKLYYSSWNAKTIVDRGCWGTPDNLKLLKQYCPNKPKIIVLVRDLNEVLGSFINWSLKNPGNFLDKYKTIEEKCDHLMDSNGQIVKCLYAAQHLNKHENKEIALFVNYQDLVNNTQKTLEKIYSFLGLKIYSHNFDIPLEFKPNAMQYSDECIGENLHLLKPNIKKSEYSYEEILPASVIEKYKKYNANYLKA